MDKTVINLYEDVLSGKLMRLPRGIWTGCNAIRDAKVLLHYVLTEKHHFTVEEIKQMNLVRFLRSQRLGGICTSTTLYPNGITSPVYLVSEIYNIPVHEFNHVPSGHWNDKQARIDYYNTLINSGVLTRHNYKTPKSVNAKYKNLYENYDVKEIQELLGVVEFRQIESDEDIIKYVEVRCKEQNITLQYLKDNWSSLTLNKYFSSLIHKYKSEKLYTLLFNEPYTGTRKPPAEDWEQYKECLRAKACDPTIKLPNFDATVTYSHLRDFVELCVVELMGCKDINDLPKVIAKDSWVYQLVKTLKKVSKTVYGEFHNEVRRALNIPIQDYPPFTGKWLFENNIQEYITYIENKYDINENNVTEMWTTLKLPELFSINSQYKLWELTCFLSFKPDLSKVAPPVRTKILKSPICKAYYEGCSKEQAMQIFRETYKTI